MDHFKTVPIDRVKNITKQNFLKNYYGKLRPVVMENLIDDWEASKKWNLDYMQEKAGDLVVPLYDNTPTKGRQSSHVKAAKMKMHDYLEILKTKPTDLRMFFYNILDNIPELTKDFSYPDIGLKFFKRLPVLFFGGEGSSVLMHYDIDLSNNVLFHFHGKKKVLLFPPSQTKYLYRIPYTVHNLETIDMDNPDFEKYPALKNAQPIEATLNHGDALYIPSGYWHYIKYLNGSFSMSLRALPRKPLVFGKMMYNVFIMRHFENLMRKMWGQKWIDYKENNVVKKANKKYGLQA